MGSRLKKEIINKEVIVKGFAMTKIETNTENLILTITNDSHGKTLSIRNDSVQFTIPFEPIEEYLK